MFHSVKIKLTVWYLLIIMLVSVFFSVAIYKALTQEIDRFERIQRLRIEHRLEYGFPERFGVPRLDKRDILPYLFLRDPELIEDSKNRLKITLATINIAILCVSAIAG